MARAGPPTSWARRSSSPSPPPIAGYHFNGPSYSSRLAFALAGAGLLLHRKPLGVVRAVLVGLSGAIIIAIASAALLARFPALSEGLPWLGGAAAMAAPIASGLSWWASA